MSFVRFAGVALISGLSAAAAWAVDDGQIHLGVSTCANSACHGGAAPNPESNVNRNEYTVWLQQDPHSKAYKSLLSDRGQRIARNLGLGAAQEQDFCLDCHADNIPEERQAISFDITDGVGCEACHGGAVNWLGIHSTGLASREQNVAAGLYPTEDPAKRADMCLDCHFGAEDQFANHQLMGAGHPRIAFELDTYTYVNAHHTVDADYVKRKDLVDSASTAAIGAAKMTERRMKLLASAEHGQNGFFPEFVFFECHSCHRSMNDARFEARAGSGIQPGIPTINDSHIQIMAEALDTADPAMAAEVRKQLTRLHQAAAQGREPLVRAATQMRELSAQASQALSQRRIASADMEAMLKNIADAGAKGEFNDYSAAEQATLVLGSVISALSAQGAIDAGQTERLLAELDKAYAVIDKDDAYKPAAFVQAMKSMQSAIR